VLSPCPHRREQSPPLSPPLLPPINRGGVGGVGGEATGAPARDAAEAAAAVAVAARRLLVVERQLGPGLPVDPPRRPAPGAAARGFGAWAALRPSRPGSTPDRLEAE
jgi:hypothetical protein